ncbi:Neurotrypsin [Sciurus carolinensis]|uniref:Neurotrypsin n=1 Tax=Sciurus carolinensis TaxID=30640 RepID=A0AA41MP56_SCICA|nr:Neurotrypsin [Sciurus carolinensis]
MTPAGLLLALMLGVLREATSVDPLRGYPLRPRHPPPGRQHAFSSTVAQRRPGTPAPSPRSPPAARAPRLPGVCPAGAPWVNETARGAPCLRWAEVPALLERSPPEGWAPLRGQRHNFCRSPDGAGAPWCFYRSAPGKADWGYCGCWHGSVRLHGGKNESEGTVEVCERRLGHWGAICSSHWGDPDASVICCQLQLGGKGVARHTPVSGLRHIPIHWRSVHCRGDEESILLCEKEARRGGACPQETASVSCFASHGPEPLAIRLAGGRSPREGRVELYRAGRWGTICDDQWDDADAAVVCRQLGLSGIAKAWTQAYFGEGSGPIMLDEVHCTGNELSIEQCPKSSWGDHNCGHREDAGVSCAPLTDGRRLAGGPGSREGRLRCTTPGGGEASATMAEPLDTRVACHQLRLGYARGGTEAGCTLEAGCSPL